MQRTHDLERASTNVTAPLVAVVDDDAAVRRSTCRLLRSFGFQAEAFDSAEAFLAADHARRIACVVLDVRMPGMDGLALQQHLADRDPPLAIVFVTAHASAEEERRARQAGALDVLRKPVAADALLRVLRSVVDVGPPSR